MKRNDSVDKKVAAPLRKRAERDDRSCREIMARIERDISSGQLGPGVWLKQIDLEHRYGAKRLDIRQALELLVERGFVRHIQRRGYRVEEFDPVRVQQIMEIRAALEVEAVDSVIELIDEPTLAAMDAAATRFRASLETETPGQQEVHNREFHLLMLSKCPNRELVGLLTHLRNRIPAWASEQRNTQAILRTSADQHFEIIGLIRKKDAGSLKTLMRRHNLTSR